MKIRNSKGSSYYYRNRIVSERRELYTVIEEKAEMATSSYIEWVGGI